MGRVCFDTFPIEVVANLWRATVWDSDDASAVLKAPM